MTDHEVAVEMGRNFANTMFNDMLNVKYQGATFKWENFPSMFSGICAATLYTAYGKIPNDIEKLESVAKQSFEEEGERLKVEYQKTKTLPVSQ